MVTDVPRRVCAVFGMITAAAVCPALADVVTDGTAGRVVHLAGPEFAIGADLGTRTGRNLFHSFEHFALDAGERATFSGPGAIRNVISRVTGGQRSEIDGTLRSTIPGADFYFLNPAGVVFGPNARLDLQGSFHVSTADELRFADGTTFNASNPSSSSFTVAAPEAFGFLGAEPSRLALDRSILGVLPGATFSLVGGDVRLEHSLVRAEAGTVQVAAIGGTGAARIADAEVTGDQLADVTLRDQTFVDATGDGGGTILIRGGRLVVEQQSVVATDNLGGAESHSRLDVMTAAIDVLTGSGLSADGFGTGSAGVVTVQAGEIELRAGGVIRSSTFGQGNAGTVTATADRVLIDGGGATGLTGIATRAEQGSAGIAGSTNVTAGTLIVVDEGQISSSTLAEGDGGEVIVTVDRLLIDGESDFAGIFSDAQQSSGNAGVVEIDASRGEIELVAGGLISSSTYAEGNAGTVMVKADRLLIDGAGAPGGTGITSRAEQGSTGVGGSAEVRAGTLTIVEGGEISSSTFTDKRAGDVTVRADRLRIDGAGGFAGISSDARGSTGGAGVVRVNAGDLELVSGGQISSRTSADGDAGTVTVEADRLLIDGAGATGPTGIASRAEEGSTGVAGSVTVEAHHVRITNGGQIQSSNRGIGGAGDVIVNANDRLLLFNRAAISTDSAAKGGGEIRLLVGDAMVLRDSDVTTSVQGGTDPTAGNISVDPQVLVIDSGRIQANAAGAPGGKGGEIVIVADNILVRSGDFQALVDRGDISATGGPAGVDGTIVVEAPEVDLAGGLVVLDGVIVDIAPLRERCGARRDIGASSFTGVGRGGLPPSPDRPLSSAHLPAAAGEATIRAGFEATGEAVRAAVSAGLAPPCVPLK